MSAVGLAVGVVLVSVVSGLVVVSVAVEGMVVLSKSIVEPLGDSWVGCAVMGLGGAGLALMWCVAFLAVIRAWGCSPSSTSVMELVGMLHALITASSGL